MPTPLTLNGLRAIKVRIIVPWRGVWVADVTLDPDDVSKTPRGGVAASLVLGSKTLKGTVDGSSSGTFSNKSAVRVVGGKGAWDKTVPAQHFYNSGGVLKSDRILATTAAAVGESVSDPTPVTYGEHYVRSAGPASRVFEDRDWYVDVLTGVATVAAWPEVAIAAIDANAQVTDFDITQKRASLTGEQLILPGTKLVDPTNRFGVGVVPIVRDVEQTFSSSGSTAEVWCSDAKVSRLPETIANLVREFAGTAHLKTYKYRFVGDSSGKIVLQSLTPNAPDLNPIDQWTGLSGGQAKITAGTEIVVGFVGADPSQPYLVSFSPLATPREVDLAGGATYLAPAPWAIALQTALTSFASALASDPFAAVAAAALSAALAALPPNATTLVKAT